jgi:pimeloyl-ACP methyl ester carboxylesterase
MSEDSIYKPIRPPRPGRLTIRNVDYAVTEWGDDNAPLLIFLHGFADCGATFQFVVDAFENDWHVIAPDWRGFGDTRVEAEAFWFPDYLADLDQLLQHYSANEPVRLIGHSMGGNIAGLYSGTFPDRVAALVSIEGFGLTDTTPADAPDRYREWITRSRDRPDPVIRDSFDMLAQAILRRNPHMTTEQAAYAARCWAVATDGGSVCLKMNPVHKLPNAVLYRRAEAEACWQQVTAEALLVAGRDSSFGSPEDLPFPRRQTAWIDNSGHMLHFEQPAALARVIEAFLTKPGHL